MTGNTDIHLLSICIMQRHPSPSHRGGQAVDCGMLSHSSSITVRSCWILGGTGMLCRIRLSRASQTCSMGDMSGEYAGHGRSRTFSGSRNCVLIIACIIMLKPEVMWIGHRLAWLHVVGRTAKFSTITLGAYGREINIYVL